MEDNSRPPKRRGRPVGSKNKRSRVTVTNPSENVLAVPAGSNVIAAVYEYANRRQLRGLGVITAQGTVKTVTLYQPNIPFFLACNDTDYRLLYFMGNFYGSPSSIRPFAAFVNRDGNLHTGIVQGELTAKSDMILGFSYINETESIKLKLPPLPLPLTPYPRALPASPLFLDPYAGLRSATSALPLAVARFRIATGGLPEFSSGAARSRIAAAGAGRLTEFSLGAGRFRPATNGLFEFSSGGGSSRVAYGVPAARSPSPLIACLMTNNPSSISGQRSLTGLLGGQAFIKRENY